MKTLMGALVFLSLTLTTPISLAESVSRERICSEWQSFAEAALRAKFSGTPESFVIRHLQESNPEIRRLMIDIIGRAYSVAEVENTEAAMNKFGAAEYDRCIEIQ